jgi:AbrB family looped-hinge helix DNA binding protein
MTQTVIAVNEQGRVVVPAGLRRELGLSSGTQLVAYVEDGRLILEPRAHLLRRMQREFREAGDAAGERNAVESLIAERRTDAQREAE